MCFAAALGAPSVSQLLTETKAAAAAAGAIGTLVGLLRCDDVGGGAEWWVVFQAKRPASLLCACMCGRRSLRRSTATKFMILEDGGVLPPPLVLTHLMDKVSCLRCEVGG
jgi:hypothetical protein